jgi:SpoVK/Ycf46/Vps4 family AAA+-type ATPase
VAGGQVVGGAVTARAVADVTVGDARDDLARLATPIETARDWNQLVLPGGVLGELHDLVDQAEQRQFVLAESGFAARPGQPRGVTAVFAGPSGTGKTLAARIVAGELGLPLYAINLAATVSKYIGETERNLERVFSAAERTDAVLLFDEAEALFGKRSEVQDARDRYANIEVAYLLQRMERYDGVAILATNLLSHFDDAFARRLSFCVYFPYPDAADRRRIWDAVFPAQVALSGDLDLDEVADSHPLSGGHIRNIAVAATSIARARGTTVDRASVMRAIDREYAKLGQVPDTVAEALP